jgi:hypothetical protein
MDVTAKVESAIKEYEAQLLLLNTALEQEMQKHYKTRKTLLLDFLYKEKVRYQFALSEFKKVLDV